MHIPSFHFVVTINYNVETIRFLEISRSKHHFEWRLQINLVDYTSGTPVTACSRNKRADLESKEPKISPEGLI